MAMSEGKFFKNDLTLELNTSLCSSNSVLSPVTDLTLNLSSLSTGYSFTPRKRLSWSNSTPNRSYLSEEVEGFNSISKTDLHGGEEKLLPDNILNNQLNKFDPLRYCGKENIPSNILEGQPNYKKHLKNKSISATVGEVDTDSQDCGYSESLSTQEPCRSKFFEAHAFQKLSKHIKDDTEPCDLQQKVERSPSKDSSSNVGQHTKYYASSSSGFGDDDTDDGFLDVFEMDKLIDEKSDVQLPINMTGLLTKPLSSAKLDNQSDTETEKKTEKCKVRLPIRRCLSMISTPQAKGRTLFKDSSLEITPVSKIQSKSEVERKVENSSPTSNIATSFHQSYHFNNNTPCSKVHRAINVEKDTEIRSQLKELAVPSTEQKVAFKRPDPPKDLTSPIQSKRRKSVPFSTHASESQLLVKKKVSLQRCFSESEVIMRALQKSYQEPDLIGDFSKPYALPVVKGKHQDLKSIAPETVVNLIKGNYSNTVANYTLVDCRYPYEYEGGHIQGAKNIYTEEGIFKELISSRSNTADVNCKRHIVVFHCEYSSERAPKLCRYLRNKDRETNDYPSLYHPEIYLLHGGYKAFFGNFKEFCEPQDYKPMCHKDHENDFRHFRSKSKSWSNDCKSRVAVRPGLQF